MISIENKFIYTHIGRTGGGSVEAALLNYGSKKPHKAPYFLNKNNVVKFDASQHWTSMEERLALGEELWGQCFKFTIVRNPWARILSQFTGHVYKEMPSLSFEEYIRRSFKEGISHDDFRFIRPCMDWITDSDENILVDYIGKYETLQESFDHICDVLNIPKSILPFVNKSIIPDDNQYREYYTPEMELLVATAFEKDIKEFGYKF